MDERTIRLLEFDLIKEALARETETAWGKEQALNLTPATEADVVKERLAETGEAYRYLDHGGEVPLGGIRDLRPVLTKAKVQALLLPEELLAVRDTLEGLHRLRESLEGVEGYPRLVAKARQIEPQEQLLRELRRSLTDEGEVADTASTRLATLRTQIRTLQNRVREKMEEMARSPELRKYLQEGLVTLRNGRYVLPVRAEFKAQVSGVIHDASASGATLFVEPMAVVEINNRLREVISQEREEVEKILRALTVKVGQVAESLEHSLAAAVALDLMAAKARLALKMKAVPPEIVSRHSLRFKGARHPLLRGKVVPIDLVVGEDFDLLVITGPNTGGKTVALKTAGLLTLMAQSGLFLPAEEASLPVFTRVLVDIGDEQSIAQNLSTFSAHLATVIRILREADRDSLVLIDELGVGTDPVEGAALGRAILEELRERRVLTIVTTHYSELKVYAAETPRVSNASLEFDAVTLQPTYRLIIGLPGRSNALEIAGRLGLEEKILARARQFMGTRNLELEGLIGQLNAEKYRLEEARRQAEEDLKVYRELRREYETKMAQLKAERQDLLLEGKRAVEEAVRMARQEIDRLLGELRAIRSQEAEARAREARERLQQLAREAIPVEESPAPPAEVVPENVAVGDTVLIKTLRQEGRVLAVDGHQAMIEAGIMKVTVPLHDLARLEKTEKAQPEPTSRDGYAGLARMKAREISPEIHLRRLTVDEALASLAKYLDDAYLAGLSSVRVIHGKGTGTLRQAVRSYLQSHPHVRSFRPGGPTEGGDGVTVAELGD